MKREGLSDTRVALITKKENDFLFLVIDAALASDNTSRFRKNLLERI